MNMIVRNHPETKLFSLPKLGSNKTIELGVKGSINAVKKAMADIQADDVTEVGFPWSEI